MRTGSPDLARLTFDDPAVYDMISQADTIGVFQVEVTGPGADVASFAARVPLLIWWWRFLSSDPGLFKTTWSIPTCAVRGGTRQLLPLLEPSLQETLGVVLFQEQVLKVARDLAGFTAGQGAVAVGRWGPKMAHW
ncbi:MAG: hypothetical protein IPL78_24645 [Chloroflexi bacterium]|nr:hypothetical protein [Chloroflexota bacterium]